MDLKIKAARRALELVKNGMTIGLGSGTTTTLFIKMLAEHLATGAVRDLQCVPTSEKTADLSRELDIPLTSLANHPSLDLAVDGADEVDKNLNLIKGLGKALLREKIVAVHANKFVIIVDQSKMVSILGTLGPLPVEIVRFEAKAHVRWLSTISSLAELWFEPDGKPVVTDNGNYLALCWFSEGISEPLKLSQILNERPGIVEHGLFIELADEIIVAQVDRVDSIEP